MRLWNLTEFSEVEDRVLLSFAGSPKRLVPRHKRNKQPVPVTIAVCAAAFTAVLTFLTVQASSNKFTFSPAEMAFAQSVPEEKPPFDSLFANRFEDQWTRALEQELIGIANQRLCAQAEELAEQVTGSVFSNQQEDLSEKVNRLDRDTIARISRSRKSDR